MHPLHAHLPGVDEQRIRRLRREDYDRLVEAGAFRDEKVELIRGVIVRMVPQGPPHAGPIQRLNEILVLRLAGRASVRVQLPIIAPDESEPEPDLAIVPRGDYDEAHPSGAFLIVEVANTSLDYDRGTKTPLYAAMGVPEYWIVDVPRGTVEVHREPVDERYGRVTTHKKGESITLASFADITLEVSAIVK